LKVFLTILFLAAGAFQIWNVVRAFRTGRVVWYLWWSRQTSYRKDDPVGFKTVLMLEPLVRVIFFALAAWTFSLRL
jgi:hypothetical protein